MMLSARRALIGALGAGALTGAVLCAAAPSAFADPPPNCTAGDLAQVASGVSAATSAYLFTHPDVNAFFTGLHGKPRDEIKSDVIAYMDANPVIASEMTGIRQPLIDIKNRCGFAGLGNPDSPAS